MSKVVVGADEEALELLAALLDYDPLRRPAAAEALKYRYFRSLPGADSEQAAQAQARRAADIERLRCTVSRSSKYLLGTWLQDAC